MPEKFYRRFNLSNSSVSQDIKWISGMIEEKCDQVLARPHSSFDWNCSRSQLNPGNWQIALRYNRFSYRSKEARTITPNRTTMLQPLYWTFIRDLYGKISVGPAWSACLEWNRTLKCYSDTMIVFQLGKSARIWTKILCNVINANEKYETQR